MSVRSGRSQVPDLGPDLGQMRSLSPVLQDITASMGRRYTALRITTVKLHPTFILLLIIN